MREPRISVDVSIDHADGQTVIKGIEQPEVKSFRDAVRNSSGKTASITFRGVKQIDVLRPDGSPQQTILGEPRE